MNSHYGGSDTLFAQVLAAPYRPLFLAAILAALLSVMWWPLGPLIGIPAPVFPSPSLWHAHELIFGFAGAATGGYLLTALPSWTGADPICGWRLKLLVGLWVFARFTMATADWLPSLFVVIVNSGYFLVLAGLLFQGIVTAKAYRRSFYCIAVLAMSGLDGALLAGASWGNFATSSSVLHVMILLFALMILNIGSTAIPAFTRNWLMSRSCECVTVFEGTRNRYASIAFLLIAFAFFLVERERAEGVALMVASLLILVSMRKWQTHRVLGNPLLVALHGSFLFLPLGLAVMGSIKAFEWPLDKTTALHILTMGAMAGLIMAISGRASSHIGDGNLKASRVFIAAVALIWLATITRASVLVLPSSSNFLFWAACFWCLGWMLFLFDFRHALKGPPPRPVLSGKRLKTLPEMGGSV